MEQKLSFDVTLRFLLRVRANVWYWVKTLWKKLFQKCIHIEKFNRLGGLLKTALRRPLVSGGTIGSSFVFCLWPIAAPFSDDDMMIEPTPPTPQVSAAEWPLQSFRAGSSGDVPWLIAYRFAYREGCWKRANDWN